MKRKEYLEICQASSIYENGDVPQELKVTYEGNKYIAYSYELWYNSGKAQHTAVLMESESGSIRKVMLDKVEI